MSSGGVSELVQPKVEAETPATPTTTMDFEHYEEFYGTPGTNSHAAHHHVDHEGGGHQQQLYSGHQQQQYYDSSYYGYEQQQQTPQVRRRQGGLSSPTKYYVGPVRGYLLFSLTWQLRHVSLRLNQFCQRFTRPRNQTGSATT